MEAEGFQVRKSGRKPQEVSGGGEIVEYTFLAKYPYL